jgi:multidrug resistance protein MdtO
LVMAAEFSFPTSLAIARDRVMGVLIGLMTMWLVFDNIWPAPAAAGMRGSFVSSLRSLAQLALVLDNQDRGKLLAAFQSLREEINTKLSAVTADAGVVQFEYGSRRREQMAARETVLRWQTPVETIFLNLLAWTEFRLQTEPSALPSPVAEAAREFRHGLSFTMLAAANSIERRTPLEPLPDMRSLLNGIESAVRQTVPAAAGDALSPRAYGFLSIARQITAVSESMSKDLEFTATFA